MKKYFIIIIFVSTLFIILSACQDDTIDPKIKENTKMTIAQNDTTESYIFNTVPTVTSTEFLTTAKTESTWFGFHPEWTEPNPVIDKNRRMIYHALPASDDLERHMAAIAAHYLAEVFFELGIPEFKEIEIIGSSENGYVVRFIDINKDEYRTNIGRRSGSFNLIWKEGQGNPIYVRY